MQRSRSSSNIPLPKFKRTLSSESLKNSQPPLKRTNSSTQLDPRKSSTSRPSTLSNPHTQYGSAAKHSTSKRSSSTPLRPISARLISPAQILTTQKINDKKFIGDQLRKISAFFEERLDDFDQKSLRNLTLNSFVNLITVLFKEIDPRININMANYKEIVFKYLKLYKYPGPVSITMLKTVNTNHSWPAVLSMFGWLVDLINDMNGDYSKEDKVRSYVLSTFINILKNQPTKGVFTHYLEEAVGFDRAELEVLELETEKLKAEKEEKEKAVAEIKAKEREAFVELEKMKQEIKDYNEGTIEAKIKDELNQAKADLDVKEQENEHLVSSIRETKTILSNQKYSVQDKEELVKQIQDMEYMLNLKKQDLDKARHLKDDYDYKETNLRREIETEVHAINNRLLKLKLGLVNTDATKIQLPDRGFLNENFLQIIEEKKQNIQQFEDKLEAKLIESKKTQVVFQTKWEKVLVEESNMKKQLTLLEAEHDKLSLTKERVIVESNLLEEQNKKKLDALTLAMPDVEATRKTKIKLHQKLLSLEDRLEERCEHSIEFFQKIYNDKIENSKEMQVMMTNILENCFQALKQRVDQRKAILEYMNNISS